MRSANREDVLAQIDDAMSFTGADHARSHAGEPAGQDEPRLPGQRAARIHAAYETLLGSPPAPGVARQPRDLLVGDGEGHQVMLLAAGPPPRGTRAVFQICRRGAAAPDGRAVDTRSKPYEVHGAWLAAARDLRLESPRDRDARRLADHADDGRGGVGRESRERLLHREAADRIAQIATAHADHLRDSLAALGDQAHDFLGARS